MSTTLATPAETILTLDDIARVKTFLLDLQKRLCDRLMAVEHSAGGTGEFLVDNWERAEGGGGRSCVFADGLAIEKAGVMFSHIQIKALPASATARHPEIAGAKAEALGVSVVIHPTNPNAPTSHLNVRLFVAQKEGMKPIWWMGGGFDLTPIYGFEEDCVEWHQKINTFCTPFGENVYSDYKKACDDYFFNKHRNEQRGIGGIFYDDLNEWGFETCFKFMQEVGNGFIEAYLPILERRFNLPSTPKQRDFQLYRRGRYVEYNLVYDRGTLFGLQTGGRIESILVSLPNLVSWQYCPTFEVGSDEEKLTSYYLIPQAWGVV